MPYLFNQGQQWAAVENVVVSRGYQGNGIGVLLMDKAQEICRSYGCSKIILSSNLVRHDAHRFYRRLGWRVTHLGYSTEPCNNM